MTNNLYITNYCDKRCTPFQSITRLTSEETYKLANELSQNAGPTFTSFSRFTASDFDGYYKKRKCTEEWLLDKIISLDLRISVLHMETVCQGWIRSIEWIHLI